MKIRCNFFTLGNDNSQLCKATQVLGSFDLFQSSFFSIIFPSSLHVSILLDFEPTVQVVSFSNTPFALVAATRASSS